MTTTETPTLLATSRRDADITRRAETGEDLTAISRDYDMTRERVRQIVQRNSRLSNDEIREARRRFREDARAETANATTDLVRRTAEENPEATISSLADLCNTTPKVVRDALPWTERERRTDPQAYSSVSDDEVFAEIRRVVDLPGGSPLTGSFYDTHREGGVSHARLLQRYETWTGACRAAGVEPQGPNTSRTYTRRWTPEDMTGWVWRYLSSTPAPSYARFEHWLREQDGAPSGQTIRNTIGSWVEMKRRAIEDHASSED